VVCVEKILDSFAGAAEVGSVWLASDAIVAAAPWCFKAMIETL